jgi:putative oxidoreductase
MKKLMLSPKPINADLAILLLRLTFGVMFMYYGYQKLLAFNAILPNFTDYLGIGSKLSLILVVFAELGCGFLVLIGLLTRLSVIPILITMVVAYFIAHGNDPFDAKQLAFLFLLLSVVIFVTGSGKYAVDRLLMKY